MKHRLTYNHTVYTCFLGYIVQAVIVNFAPLLFVMFHEHFGIDLPRITALVTVNFSIQLEMDLCSSVLIRKFGYRTMAVAAQIFSFVGLVCLATLPDACSNPYVGLLLATALYAVGGGLDEVIISPVVELCPSKHKAASMSILHSFYCWGQLFTILISTGYFALFGIRNFRYLCLFWAALPLIAAVMFMLVPMPKAMEAGNAPYGVRRLFSKKRFLVLALVMLCGGAAEQCISQWASTFAESGLHVDKAIGDLAGPCLFALLMGTARVLYAKFSERLRAPTAMLMSGGLCVASFLLASLAKDPFLGLCGCALAGFSVGIFWPCTLSLGASGIRDGGVALFAMLALFGDIGCTVGPTLVGLVSSAAGNSLNAGIFAALVFPVLLIIGILLFSREGAKEQ